MSFVNDYSPTFQTIRSFFDIIRVDNNTLKNRIASLEFQNQALSSKISLIEKCCQKLIGYYAILSKDIKISQNQGFIRLPNSDSEKLFNSLIESLHYDSLTDSPTVSPDSFNKTTLGNINNI